MTISETIQKKKPFSHEEGFFFCISNEIEMLLYFFSFFFYFLGVIPWVDSKGILEAF